LDRYYDHKQTEILDGPAATLFKQKPPESLTDSEQDSEERVTPRTALIQDKMRDSLLAEFDRKVKFSSDEPAR